MLHGLPASHAGPDPGEEGHGGRVLAAPLAQPLVETSSNCTFLPSLSLSRACNRSLSNLGISDEYLFPFFVFVSLILISSLVIELMFVLVGSSLSVTTSGVQWFILLRGHVGSDPRGFVHPPNEANTVLYC